VVRSDCWNGRFVLGLQSLWLGAQRSNARAITTRCIWLVPS
jgi:hypothetical protein